MTWPIAEFGWGQDIRAVPDIGEGQESGKDEDTETDEDSGSQ